jgi:hypothetical protein
MRRTGAYVVLSHSWFLIDGPANVFHPSLVFISSSSSCRVVHPHEVHWGLDDVVTLLSAFDGHGLANV